MNKYIGEEIVYPFAKHKTKIKDVKTIDNKKQIAYLEDGAILSLDILKTPDGKYLTEVK